MLILSRENWLSGSQMPGHNLFRRLEPLFPFPEYKPKLGLYILPATWILYLHFFRRSCNMCARTSLLKEVRITVFILVPSVSVVSFFRFTVLQNPACHFSGYITVLSVCCASLIEPAYYFFNGIIAYSCFIQASLKS